MNRSDPVSKEDRVLTLNRQNACKQNESGIRLRDASFIAVRDDSVEGGASGEHSQVILATAGYDHVIKFWKAHTGECVKQVQHNESHVNALSIAPNGLLFAAAAYQLIKLFDLRSMRAPLVSYDGPIRNVTSVGFQKENRWMYTGSDDGVIRIWDMRTRNINCSLSYSAITNGSMSGITCVAVEPTHEMQMVAGDQSGHLHICDLRRMTEDLPTDCDDAVHVSGVGDNATLTASATSNTQQMSLLSRMDLAGWPAEHNDKISRTDLVKSKMNTSIQAVHVCPEGRRLATVTNKGYCHWYSRPDSGSILSQPLTNSSMGDSVAEDSMVSAGCMRAHADVALKCVFNNSGDHMATCGSDHCIRIWDTTDYHLEATLRIPTSRWVWDVAFSIDSQYMVSASSDGIARLWSIPEAEVKRQYKDHRKSITCIAFRDVKA